MRFFAVLMLLVLASDLRGQNDTSDVPPFLNYWDLTGELIKDSRFRDELEVSPDQLTQIQGMRANKEIQAELREGPFNVQVKKPRDLLLPSREEIRLSIDGLIKAELSKILTDDQVQALRPVKLTFEYPGGHMPFLDPRVRKHCGISEMDLVLLRPHIEHASSRLNAELSRLQTLCSTKVFTALPKEAKTPFAACIGNNHFAAVPGDLDIKHDALPFAPSIRTISTVEEFLQRPKVLTQAGISTSQAESLSQICESSNAQVREFVREKGTRGFPELFNQVERESFQRALDVLNSSQFLYLARERSLNQFMRGFAAQFEQSEFVKYLGLEQNEVEMVAAIARTQDEELKAGTNKLNRVIFDGLCLHLSPHSKTRMQSVFDHVWDR